MNDKKGRSRKKRVKTGEGRTRRRFLIVTRVCLAALFVVALRLVWIAVFNGDAYTQAVLAQTESSTSTVTAKRGDIVDSNGITLAASTLVYNLILDPKVILTDEDRYLDSTVAAIEEYFDISESETRELIENNPARSYIVIAEELTYSEVEDFIAAKEADSSIAGVWLEEEYKRNYTFSTLASSVLGFLENGSGAYGLEAEYDDVLTGTDGVEYTYVNSENVVETVRKEAEDGNTIKLSLDYNIQTIIENHIAEFLSEVDAENVAVIVQDPDTGAILAMADSKTFDCNNPHDLSVAYSDEEIEAMTDEETTEALSELWANYCISEAYEPGSTYKPFTVASALEENIISMSDTYYCGGSLTYYDTTISCHKESGHGTITAEEGIAYSCNVALMEISQQIGAEIFSTYQRSFGFGQLTGIDLPGEISCENLLYDETMSVIDLATNSFGQNFDITMIQMSTAFCSLINGGYYYQPYLVSGIYTSDGELIESTEATLVSRTVTEETSDSIKQALRLVVIEGSAQSAAVDGYIISGKSGTAEKLGRDDDVYLGSFIGFAPYDDPEVVCYVVIDEPDPDAGTGLAAALFGEIMEEVLPYMGITTASEDTDPFASETETSSDDTVADQE